jgi:hypothetical protein
MTRIASVALLALVLVSPSRLDAQQGPRDTRGPVVYSLQTQTLPPPDSSRGLPAASADQVRNQLQNMLYRLPPNVRAVLQADPGLIDRPDYLATYPELMEFLKQHPEVARNPAYYLGNPSFNRGPDPLEIFGAILAGTGLFFAFITIMVTIAVVARHIVDYRRWVRQTRVQTEVHTKILDRMQNNEDLLAYVQTPAGRHFLEMTPLQTQAEPATAAPFGRILWSVQAGVVLAALGGGFLYARGTLPEEIVPAFTVLGIIVMALGAGAVMSAVVAYLLSSRFGLLPARRQET